MYVFMCICVYEWADVYLRYLLLVLSHHIYLQRCDKVYSLRNITHTAQSCRLFDIIDAAVCGIWKDATFHNRVCETVKKLW